MVMHRLELAAVLVVAVATPGCVSGRESAPSSANDDGALALVETGERLEREKKPAEAASAYERAVALDPSLALAHHRLGAIRRDRGDIDGARRELDAATRLDPGDAGAFMELGLLELEKDRAAEAARAFEGACSGAPGDADARYHLALAREAEGDLLRARSSYEKAVELDPRHAPALNNLAVLLERACRSGERPLELWRRAIEADPTLASAEKNLGAALLRDRGQPLLALSHLERYLELGGDDRARVLGWISQIRDRTGARPGEASR